MILSLSFSISLSLSGDHKTAQSLERRANLRCISMYLICHSTDRFDRLDRCRGDFAREGGERLLFVDGERFLLEEGERFLDSLRWDGASSWKKLAAACILAPATGTAEEDGT